ncbi:MAG: Gfo/Idh/MocA family oxidoreductase [Myxococcales bacterium]|nr:Gfo/Idh/MocA family oxidoreductase [Myxococcales bacterium]
MKRRDWIQDASATVVASSLLTFVGAGCKAGNTKKVRLAVAGGNFGTQFFFHEHPNCEVTAVTDLRAERRDRLKSVYGCDTAYDSLEELLKKEKDVDAVALFTDAPLHAKHVLMCFKRGLHVLSAVPACVSVEEAQQLAEVQRSSGLKYMLAETSYYRPSCIFARNYFKKGLFGTLFYTEAEYYHDKGNLDALMSNKGTRFWNPDGTPSWRWGFPPMGYPTHALGFLVGVTDERITEVSCLGWGSEHPYVRKNAYDNPFWNETALMRTNKGHALRANVFWLVAGHGERASWYGDKATLLDADKYRGRPVLDIRTGRTQSIAFPEFHKSDMIPPPMRHSSGHGDSHVLSTAEFINGLADDRMPEIDLDRGLAMTVPGIIAHRSALKGGEQLKVPKW